MRRIITVCVSILLLAVILTLTVFTAGFYLYEYERFSPSSADELTDDELLAILYKGDMMTDEDYAVLYYQTGLTRIGVDRVLARCTVYDILSYKEAYFDTYSNIDDGFAPLMNAVYTDRFALLAPLEPGDIIVTSATRFALWDVGHSSIVIDGDTNEVIEAATIGSPSAVAAAGDFEERPDFMVLRPKLDDDVIARILTYTEENLLGLKYDPTVGVLSPKYKENLTATQCAHIIWYAFMSEGIDIDSDGGLIVTPEDIAKSDVFELVQVFGFDPDKLWD